MRVEVTFYRGSNDEAEFESVFELEALPRIDDTIIYDDVYYTVAGVFHDLDKSPATVSVVAMHDAEE